MTGPPAELANLDRRLLSAPRLTADDQLIAQSTRVRMLPSLAVAHTDGDAAVCCWCRPKENGRVGIFLGGSLTRRSPVDSEGAVFLPFPAGSRGAVLSDSQRDGALNLIGAWEQLAINIDALEAPSLPTGGLQLEDVFALLPNLPMAIAAIARPLESAATVSYLDELSTTVERLQPMAEGEGLVRLKLDRALQELRYLEYWASLGLWELRLFVGGTSARECKAIAGLLAASGGLVDKVLRVRLADAPRNQQSDERWSEQRIVTADALAAVMRSPARELPGFRLTDPLDFDVTPEKSGAIVLGSVLDATGVPCSSFSLHDDSINRHVFVTGATGSGKSQTVRTLLERLVEKSVPWLVIEPAKAEYAAMAGRVRHLGATVSVVRPGRPDVPPASLNPLEPSSIVVGSPPRREFFNLQTHLDLVRALFTAAFDAEEPFPQILAAALTRSYEGLGWNLALGRAVESESSVRPRFPTLADLQRSAREAVDAVQYGKEVRDNVRGFVDVRIGSLRLGTTARFFEGGHPIDLEELLATNTVFEIEDLGDDNDKAFFIGTVLIRVVELLRLWERHGRRAQGLRHVTVIEEAHRLLRNVPEDSPAAHAVTMFANLLAEVRAYGEGIVVAEQIPAKIISDVVKNSAVKLLHRLPAADDRAFVGSTMNLTEAQSAVVVALEPGDAAAHADGMDRPVLVHVDLGSDAAEAIDAVPPTAPVSPRSIACPPRCKNTPCTMETLVLAGELARVPALTLWAEIVTLSHLMGEPAGALSDNLLRTVQVLDEDRVRCALGLSATAAVARRWRYIRHFYDPRRLEVEIVAALVRQLKGEHLDRPDPCWQIGRFRWADVRRELDATNEAERASSAPLELPAAWTARGLQFVGSTWAEIRDELRAMETSLATPFTPTFLGVPNAIDECAGRMSRQTTRARRLDDALQGVLRLPTVWPSFRLYPRNEPETAL